MTDHLYRTILGVIFLISLYLDAEFVIYAVSVIMLFEAITNWRIPKIVNRIRNARQAEGGDGVPTRFNIEAERMFRFMISGLMFATYPLGSGSMLWFFPWFMAFAILGAGASGICPALALFKWLGFR